MRVRRGEERVRVRLEWNEVLFEDEIFLPCPVQPTETDAHVLFVPLSHGAKAWPCVYNAEKGKHANRERESKGRQEGREGGKAGRQRPGIQHTTHTHTHHCHLIRNFSFICSMFSPKVPCHATALREVGKAWG